MKKTLAKVLNDTLTGFDGKYSSRKVTAFVFVIAQITGFLYTLVSTNGSLPTEWVAIFATETLALFGITTYQTVQMSKNE